MATLIAHFSEENAPIWQENTMVYTIAEHITQHSVKAAPSPRGMAVCFITSIP